MVAVLLLNLGLLAYFKYTNFFLSLLAPLRLPVLDGLTLPLSIVAPIGISFYTFQTVGYLVDVYRQTTRAEENFVRYALFVSFFPKIAVGPIERSTGFLQALQRPVVFLYANVRRGLLVMLWGYFLKLVVADRCAVVAGYVFQNYKTLTGVQTLFGSFAYTIQIYTDFMGYTMIALGAAEIFGLRLTANFARPYFARSVKDFWRRWHISLSLWLRDYVYIPLGGSRCGTARKYFNVLLTFLVSGLWHGANLTFVAWGLLHGILQVLEDVWQPYGERLCRTLCIDRASSFFRFVLTVKTFLLVNFAWVFFRSPTFSDAFAFLRNCLRGGGFGPAAQFGLNKFHYGILFLGLVILFLHSQYCERGRDPLNWLDRQRPIARYALYWLIVLLIALSLNLSTQEFIYMQF